MTHFDPTRAPRPPDILRLARQPNASEQLSVSSTTSSASAALARSVFLYLGFMFSRPSKLFRPSRVDTWGGLRQLAVSADQSLSPSFVRTLMRSKSGALALFVTLLPPLTINTALGFLLFTTHSAMSLALARLQFFQHHPPRISQTDHKSQTDHPKLVDHETSDVGAEEEEDPINLHTLMNGPTIIPRHPTLLSGLAGAGAGIVQGFAFTPIENIVRLLGQSTTSLTALLIRTLRLPFSSLPTSSFPLSPTSPLSATLSTSASPLEALRTFLSSETWRKSPSWWTGWRWAVARDAMAYGVFFATFDATRRVGLRVKALFGGDVGGALKEWQNVLVIYHNPTSTMPTSEDKASTTSSDNSTSTSSEKISSSPTIARTAQAITIVSGGVLASLLASASGRPFRTCQQLSQAGKIDPARFAGQNPILYTLKNRGIAPFVSRHRPEQTPLLKTEGGGTVRSKLLSVATRVAWRAAAVGPWGFGFLVWAWVGGEI